MAASAALGVAFDAAIRFGVARILSEPPPDPDQDAISATPGSMAPREAAPVLAAAWRGALGAVAEGLAADRARDGLIWTIGED